MKVSIITTTYNDATNLVKIMNGVLKQDYKDIEYIVIDGKSNDGTVDLLNRYEKLFNGNMRYLSEEDNGIYDAINKGISLAQGDIIGCCFDSFASNHVISDMATVIEREKTDGVHGNLCYMKDGKIIRYWRQGQGSIHSGWMPGHPTLYLKREVYESYGLYKTDYKIAADYEFMVRVLNDCKVKLSYLDEILIYMNYGGTSTSSLNAYMLSLKEGHRALKENNIKNAFLIDIKRTIKVMKQFLIFD